MDRLCDLQNRLEELYDAYEGLAVLATSENGESYRAGHVLYVLNRQFKDTLRDIEDIRKKKGLSVIK